MALFEGRRWGVTGVMPDPQTLLAYDFPRRKCRPLPDASQRLALNGYNSLTALYIQSCPSALGQQPYLCRFPLILRPGIAAFSLWIFPPET